MQTMRDYPPWDGLFNIYNLMFSLDANTTVNN